MTTSTPRAAFGYITSNSSASSIRIAAYLDSAKTSIVGRSVYVDQEMEDGVYRALGTVTDIMTTNKTYADENFTLAKSRNLGGNLTGTDVRNLTLQIQSTYYRSNKGDSWQKASSALPTSPAAGMLVYLLDEDTISELIANDGNIVHLGTMRGLAGVAAPLTVPNFDSQRGASHSGIIGKSGSGKALSLDTRIPTPNGWTTMGGLKDGDKVFDEQGNPCTVLKAHDVQNDHDVYEVVFSDGSVIKADKDHLWYTETNTSRKSIAQRKFYGDAKRQIRLDDSQRNILRWEALNSDVNDVITVVNAMALIGINTGPHWAHKVAETFTIAGYVKSERACDYTMAHETTRPIITFDAQKMLEFTIGSVDPWLISHRDSAQKALLEILPNQRYSLHEYAAVLGVHHRNGAVARKIKAMGLSSISEQRTITTPAVGKVAKSFGKIATYNKRDLLLAFASAGEVVIKDQRHLRIMGSVKTTGQIFDTINEVHSIPVAKPLQLDEKIFSVDPYILGAWLGDGIASKGGLCGMDHEIKDAFVNAGYSLRRVEMPTTQHENYRQWHFNDLFKDLKELGLIKNKHIPAEYLRGSIQQRRELLAGLMDTDGTAVKGTSEVEFCNTNRLIAYGAHELAISLGYRATITEARATLYGVDCGPKWTVRWSTPDKVFNLERKIATHLSGAKVYNASKNEQRYIIDVKKIDSVPVRCITVDSASHLFLAGEAMIPTHNTAFAGYVLFSQMSHENHAIIVVDPQGQWSSENGFLFSVQKAAVALGRDVSVLRVSEDIRLHMDEEMLGRLFDHTDLWGRGFQRMGQDNKQAFSDAVASKITYTKDATTMEPRVLLSKTFLSIANSAGAMKRIYATDDKIDSLRRTLLLLAGEIPSDKEGVAEEIEADEWEDIENTWARLLTRFTPLINLFAPKNLMGGRRRLLGGQRGFLTEVMKVRASIPESPAPYVILDMSSDVTAKAKGDYAKGTGVSTDNVSATEMRRLLDNAEIKALIVSSVLDEVKAAAEDAFSVGGGNLNTQIVFDEAWRYAPNIAGAMADTPIGKLSAQLEGFALDTRKYGIGWTYILQVPSDLNKGIWRQLSYLYTGYGIIGSDKRMLGDLMDEKDRNAQMGLYDQFAPPSSTGKYPFMLTGPISPLIFTNTPVFVDAYNTVDQFLLDNAHWIDLITKRRSLPPLSHNPRLLDIGGVSHRSTSVDEDESVPAGPAETFRIGGSKTGSLPVHSTTARPAVILDGPIKPKRSFGAAEAPPF